jgi:hypothetical protein
MGTAATAVATERVRSDGPTASGGQAPEIPDRLKAVLVKPPEFPWANITNVTKADAPLLLELYRQTARLEDRHRLTYALGLVGGEEAAALLVNTLTNEFKGQTITQGGLSVMEASVRSLGLLSHESATAAAFLRQTADFEFWRQQRDWRAPPDSYGGMERIMVGNCIVGVGISGAEDVPEWLRQFAKLPRAQAAGISGAVVDAACIHDLVTRSGREAYIQLFFTQSFRYELDRWRRTPEAAPWENWYRQVNDARY